MITGLPGDLVVDGEARLDDGLPPLVLLHCLHGLGIGSWEGVLVLLQLHGCFRLIEGRVSRFCGFCSGSGCGQEVLQGAGLEEVLI